MNDETAREKLAGVLVRAGVWPLAVAERSADALLPVVREIAAEELRAAADWLAGEGPDGSLPGGCAPDETSDGLSWQKDVGDRDSALDWCQMSLRDRADDLHAAVAAL